MPRPKRRRQPGHQDHPLEHIQPFRGLGSQRPAVRRPGERTSGPELRRRLLPIDGQRPVPVATDLVEILGQEEDHGNPHRSQNAEVVPKFRNSVPIHEAEINGRPCRPGEPGDDRDRTDAVAAPDPAETEHVHDAAGWTEADARVVRERWKRRVGSRPGRRFAAVPGGEVFAVGQGVSKSAVEEFGPEVEIGRGHGAGILGFVPVHRRARVHRSEHVAVAGSGGGTCCTSGVGWLGTCRSSRIRRGNMSH